MHPIERLRFVARASGAPQDVLVRETAAALASFANDPTALVTACQRVVARQITSGPVWWLCSRILTAPEPRSEAWTAVEEIEADRTPSELAASLPDDATVCILGWPALVADGLRRRGDLEVLVVDALGEGGQCARRLQADDVDAEMVPLSGLGAAAAASDVLLVEPSALGPSGGLAVAGSRAAAAVAHVAELQVWVVAGVGRLLPERVWDALLRRYDVTGEPWDADDEVVPLSLVDRVVGPLGIEEPAAAMRRVDCPIAPELFRDPV